MDKFFLIMVEMLEELNQTHHDNEPLISLLSDLDSSIFEDGMPADPATYRDWQRIVNQYIQNEHPSSDEILCAIKKFVELYQDEYGFELDDIIADLNSPEASEKVRNIINQNN